MRLVCLSHTVDVNTTLEIRPVAKPTSSDAAILAGLVVPAVALSYIIFREPHQAGAGAIRIEILCVLLLAAVLAWRFVRHARGGPVVFLSPAGFRYLRMSADTIPWCAITRVSSRQTGAYRFMTLTLDPQFRTTFRMSLLYRLNAALGASELKVPVHRLNIHLHDLLAAANAYRRAALGAPTASATDTSTAPAVRRQPPGSAWATIGLLLVLVAAFVMEARLAPPGQGAPNLSAVTLARYGGMVRALVLQGEWWRFFTAPLLHAGPGHLFNNALALVLGGIILERRIGWQWLIAIFGFSALAGGAASCLLDGPNVVSVGASGGIVRLFAAVVVLAFREPDAMSRNKLLLVAARLLVPTLLPTRANGSMHVDVAAHLGGAIGSLLMGAIASMLWLAGEGRPRGSGRERRLDWCNTARPGSRCRRLRTFRVPLTGASYR